MSSRERRNWYQNTSWSADVETAFFKKLARARNKIGYLYAQAWHLTQSYPDVALRLLDQFFALGGHSHIDAFAHSDRASLSKPRSIGSSNTGL